MAPRRRRIHALRGTLKQFHFQLVLDLLDVDRERRLGDVLALPGAGAAPGLVDGHEEADFADVDHQPPRYVWPSLSSARKLAHSPLCTSCTTRPTESTESRPR